MQRLQAFKFELIVNGEQSQQIRRFAGACRFVYNQALALQKENHASGEKFLNYVATASFLPVWKKQTRQAWLKNPPSQALQQALKDLDKAFQNFFAKRADFPRFKKKGMGDSFRYPSAKQIKLEPTNSRIFLPKLGWLKYRNSREVLGEVRNATVSQSGGKYFVSIQTRREVESVLPKGGEIGIDVGIARFATLSDGSFFAPLNGFKKHQAKLAKYQRKMAKKVKFSNNWKKAKSKINKIHTNIANARKDFLHKTSTAISKNHAIVCVENLQIKNMSKSSKGNIENHGKKVKQKSGLNRSILDQGWGEFRRQLDYKLAWNGGHLIVVPAQYTSQGCSCCGHTAKENRASQAKFECVDCGFSQNADVNAACNILAAGHAVLACGESAQSGNSMKQEPAEVTRQSNA